MICETCQKFLPVCSCVSDPLIEKLNDSQSEMMIEISECIERLVAAREKYHKMRAQYKPELQIELIAEENNARQELIDLGVPLELRDV